MLTAVSAINATQAVVTLAVEIGEVAANKFSMDNSLTVIKAEEMQTKKEAKFNTNLTDGPNNMVKLNRTKKRLLKKWIKLLTKVHLLINLLVTNIKKQTFVCKLFYRERYHNNRLINNETFCTSV